MESELCPLLKYTTRCPECRKGLYADIDSKNNFKGLACMNESCTSKGITREILDPKKRKP
jgi:hypothetical protein